MVSLDVYIQQLITAAHDGSICEKILCIDCIFCKRSIFLNKSAGCSLSLTKISRQQLAIDLLKSLPEEYLFEVML